MNRRDYTAAVLKGLRHVTESEKERIREELDGHMEDHMLELMELGWEAEDAEEKAAACMGDPMEVSVALQKCYSYGWLIVNRVLGVLLVLLVLLSVSEFALVGRAVFQNQQARFDPLSQMGEDVRARVKQELDIELSCGNSAVKFYALGENERGELEVHWCIRNKQAFRYVAGNIDIRYYHPQDAEREILGGGGYYSTGHIRYGNDHLELPEGTESVLAVISWLDQERRIEIPITWEVGA